MVQREPDLDMRVYRGSESALSFVHDVRVGGQRLAEQAEQEQDRGEAARQHAPRAHTPAFEPLWHHPRPSPHSPAAACHL